MDAAGEEDAGTFCAFLYRAILYEDTSDICQKALNDAKVVPRGPQKPNVQHIQSKAKKRDSWGSQKYCIQFGANKNTYPGSFFDGRLLAVYSSLHTVMKQGQQNEDISKDWIPSVLLPFLQWLEGISKRNHFPSPEKPSPEKEHLLVTLRSWPQYQQKRFLEWDHFWAKHADTLRNVASNEGATHHYLCTSGASSTSCNRPNA